MKHFFDCRFRLFRQLSAYLVNNWTGYTFSRRGLREVPGQYRVDDVVAVAANSEGELEPVFPKPACIHGRLRRHDVIERRHPETSAGFQEDTEILGVAVRCAKQPEDDLGLDKHTLVRSRIIASAQQIENAGHAGTAIGIETAASTSERINRMPCPLLRAPPRRVDRPLCSGGIYP